jgi:TetR/AcrR family transcriptional regulator, regulator of cefoperazone and chloramphenicol sensitivity
MAAKMTKKPEAPVQLPESGGDATRQSLVEAGLRLFGLKGYEGASIRDIAGEAKTNIASIGYHFGGKDGLRRACAEHVAATIRAISSTALAGPAIPAQLSPQEARERMHLFIGRAVPFILADKRVRVMMHFMLREMAAPSIAFDIVYGGVMEPTHKRICTLWAAVTGEDAESESVRLGVFGVIGQVFYFRFGQEIVLRRMAWKDYGEREVALVVADVIAALDGALDRHAAAHGRAP